MGCNCGKPKCDGHCGVSPAVLQINNPSECVLFRKVEVPASMGTSVENPPKPGAYRNVLLYYNADGEAYLYSSDGIPTKVTGTTSNYEILTNKPKINGVELVGDKSLADIGVTNAINNALEPYTPTSGFAEVAFTGDYDDLENTPTPPVTHFYLVPAYTADSPSLVYNDSAHTSQTTYQEFQNAILSGPVQIHQEHDLDTYWISNIALTDIWLNEYISFYTDAEQWRGLYRWDSTDAAPFFQGSQDYYSQVQADWNVTNTSSSAYIKNKPNLATVATSGSYNDLSNKPTIPTVNNATLTIQKNGTNVQTFTANQSTNATANITVPTKTSDLTNDGATGTSVYVEESDIAPSELSGEGELITLNGTTDCSTLDTQLLGNAEQTGTPAPDSPQPISTVTGAQTVFICGKNLVEDVLTEASIFSAGQMSAAPDFQMNIAPVIRGNTYTMSIDGSQYVYGFFTSKPVVGSVSYDGTRTVVQDNPTFTAPITGYVAFRTSDSYTTAQLELGSTATTYEPYQSQSYEVNLGKNLCSGMELGWLYGTDGSERANTSSIQTIRSGFIRVQPNTTYILSSPDYTGTWFWYEYKTDKSYNLTTNKGNATGIFTTEPNTYWVRFRTNTPYVDLTARFQLELGSTATTYAPYFTPIELAKIGDYQDRIYKSDGKWYIEKQIGKVVLDGSETWSLYANNNAFYINKSDAIQMSSASDISLVYCDYYTATTLGLIYDGTLDYGIALGTANHRLNIRNKDTATVADFKTWLSTHPTTVYYALATPTDEEITDGALIRQLEGLAGALGYDGVTNIMSASPELPATLSVSTYTGSAIPPATRARAGIVRIGDGIDVDDCGTISVNAQKAPTVITIDLGNQNDWSVVYNSLGPMLALGAGSVSSSQYDNRVRVISLTPPTSTTFHNENTDTDMTLEEVFNLIESGEDVVFNNVPVGTYYDSRSQVYYPLGYAVNGVRVSDKLNYSDGAAFTGHVAINVPSPQSLDTQWDYNYPIVASISIRKLVVINGDISTTSYYLDVDGIYDGIVAD